MEKKKRRTYRKWTKESVKKALLAYHEKNGSMTYKRMWEIDGGLVMVATRHFGCWNNALAEAGIPVYTNTSRKWSKESVRKELRACHEKGCSMRYGHMRKIDNGLVSAAIKRFGSWNNALSDAGIPITRPFGKWSRESVKRGLTTYYEKGEEMSSGRFKKKDNGLLQAAMRHFGSWRNALTEAGIPIITHPLKRWSKELVKEELLACHEKGCGMRLYVMKKTNLALARAAQRYFGSWDKALIEAGIAPEPRPTRKKPPRGKPPGGTWTRERVLTELAAIMKRGESLKASDVEKKHSPLYKAARKLFSNYHEAVETLGLDYSAFLKRRNWTKEEVMEEMRKLTAQNNSFSPKWVMDNRHDLYMAAENKFGSWENAAETAGIVPADKSETATWTLEKVTQTIRSRMEQGKNMDYATAEKEEGTAFCAAAERYFGSLTEAVDAAREGLAMERTLKMMRDKGAGKRKDVDRGKRRGTGRYNVTTR